MRFATEMTDDQFIDNLIELEDAFKGFGVSDVEGPLSPTGQKLVDAIQSFNEYDQRLINAGVSSDEFEGLRKLDTGVLQQNVPGPYMKDYASGRQKRVFMDTEISPVTGSAELVPRLDPDTGGPLSYVYGNNIPQVPGSMRADELTSQMIMKLSGANAITRDHDNRALSDLVIQRGDYPSANMDVMMGENIDRRTGREVTYKRIPLYTSVGPRSAYQGRTSDVVRRLVETEMRATGGTVIDSVESLANKGILGDSQQSRRVGKILRNNPNMVDAADEVYHSLIMPEFNQQTMNAGTANQITTAPSAIRVTDLSKVRAAAEAGAFDNRRSLIYMNNRGKSGAGRERAQIKAIVPLNMITKQGKLIQDLTRIHPMTQQALHEDSMKYTRKPRRR